MYYFHPVSYCSRSVIFILYMFFVLFFSLLASQVDGVVWRIKLNFCTFDAPVFPVLMVHF